MVWYEHLFGVLALFCCGFLFYVLCFLIGTHTDSFRKLRNHKDRKEQQREVSGINYGIPGGDFTVMLSTDANGNVTTTKMEVTDDG